MKKLVKATCGFAASFALAAGSAQPASAQFFAVDNYQAQQQPAAQVYDPRTAANQRFAPPAYGYPRVAQAAELPAPAEPINSGARMAAPASAPTASYQSAQVHAPVATSAPMSYEGGYSQPVAHQSAAAYPSSSAGCATGDCGNQYASAPVATYAAPATTGCDYSGYDQAYESAPACDTGSYYGSPAPAGPRRQWFAGVYGLYLNRAGDQSKSAVAYLADSSTFTGDYYPTATVTKLTTADAGYDGTWGAEVRFGSTFGCDPCACSQPFAWEIGYWGLDTDSSSAQLILPGALSPTYTQRLYSLYQYQGLNADLDGPGATWNNRPIYTDDGMPASDDPYATDVRLLGVRVRQRFQAQNLELNFWRFGTPTAAAGVGGGRLTGLLAAGQGGYGAGACGIGSPSGGGSCGVDPCTSGSCGGYDDCGGPAYGVACGSCRPPRRFFINGLAGVRYLRVDDDFGLDQQFAVVDTPTGGNPGNAGNVPVGLGWTNQYTGFPSDDPQVIFSDYQADNELVGFQLGASMNWLVGCRWNLFADTNFGIYGNNASVYKRVYGGGDSMITFANGGGAAAVTGSETSLAYVGELRAGVGYQVSCNCRLTAAYRFIGIGGVALGAEEYQNTYWANSQAASHIDTNNSIILHGVQTGVEYKF